MDALNISEQEKKEVSELAKITVQAMVQDGFETLEEFLMTKDDERQKEMAIKYVGIAVDKFKKFAYKIRHNPEAKRVFCLRVYEEIRS